MIFRVSAVTIYGSARSFGGKYDEEFAAKLAEKGIANGEEKPAI